MTSRFAVGQRVTALVTAQGMVAGRQYQVVDLAVVRMGSAGTYARYALQPVALDRDTPLQTSVTSQPPLWIGNGHLLLEAVA